MKILAEVTVTSGVRYRLTHTPQAPIGKQFQAQTKSGDTWKVAHLTFPSSVMDQLLALALPTLEESKP